jgi:hypothetical protein
VGEIADPKPTPARFFLVSRPDSSTRSPDLLFGLILRNLVEQSVIRHHQVSLLAHADPSIDIDTPSLQAIVLFTETRCVDHHTVAQETPLSRVENTRGNLVKYELIVSDMDGVPRIGSTLETGDQMHVLGENVDDLSFSLVAPLATQNDGAVAGISSFRHGVIPRWKGP